MADGKAHSQVCKRRDPAVDVPVRILSVLSCIDKRIQKGDNHASKDETVHNEDPQERPRESGFTKSFPFQQLHRLTIVDLANWYS